MTLTMDSLCPHISQSKTRVLKSDMKTSYGITFQELKNGQKSKKLVFFGYFSGYAVLAHKHALRDIQKSPRRVPKLSPEGPGTPPGRPKRAQNGSNGPGGEWCQPAWRPQAPPDASRGRLGVILGPPGLHLGCISTPKRAWEPKKKK